MPAVIAENDVSEWDDKTGVVYHFPKRYAKILQPGTQIIYYKGSLKDRAFRAQRLSDEAHYFGAARIGKVYADPSSTKGDLFARIDDYRPFARAVSNKLEGEYLEPIPASQESNYWRNGVREISDETYQRIVSLADLTDEPVQYKKPENEGGALVVRELRPSVHVEQSLLQEGDPSYRTSKVYKRNERVRTLAVSIHGTACKGCGFDFEKAYGSHGAGFIHVHHLNPLAETDASHETDPETDVTVLCPNCHAMVHRRKDKTLTLEELREVIRLAGFNYKQ